MPLRVGILSVAHMHVWGYAGGMKRHPDVELIGAWDENPERLAKFCESCGVTPAASMDQLLGDVDAAVICSENTKHAALAAKAAEKGIDILCEKPLVTNES